MNIKTKLKVFMGILVAMIILVVALAVTNLQTLTATDPRSPAAAMGLQRALLWVLATGSICVAVGVWIWLRIPASIDRQFRRLTDGIREVADHHYDVTLDLRGSRELETVSNSFNRMVKRLQDYRNSSVSALKASKRYLETVINALHEPIIGLDGEKVVLFINNEALNVLNLRREDVLHRSAQEVAMRNDLLRRLIREIPLPDATASPTAPPNAGKGKHEPLKIYADNKESYFQVQYMQTESAARENNPTAARGVVILLKNITEFRELDTAKTTFISTISHELKTPISAILLSLQLLDDARVGKLNAEQAELTKSIHENSERLLSITGELLHMTQIESGKLFLKPKVTHVTELIEYAIKANRVQAEKFGIQIEVDYPAEQKVRKLFVDSEKVAWVLTNLLSNAIRYSPENGRVIVGVRQTDAHTVSLFVRDFGRGIDARYHESIFEHYFRVPGTKVQGSGLGLAISRDFMEAHDGTLTVESELGKGSTFTMTFHV